MIMIGGKGASKKIEDMDSLALADASFSQVTLTSSSKTDMLIIIIISRLVS